VVLFEWDNRVAVRIPAAAAATDEAWLGARPVCPAGSPHLAAHGRWTQIPAARLVHCPPHSLPRLEDFVYGDKVFPYPSPDAAPACWAAVNMTRFADSPLRPAHVYSSEVSKPNVLLAVEWTTSEAAPCRPAPKLLPAELRQCLVERRVGAVDFSGMSVMHTLKQTCMNYLQAAFPLYLPTDRFSKLVNLSAAYPELNLTEMVFVTNLQAPWLAYLGDKAAQDKLRALLVDPRGRSRHESAFAKVWVSPGLGVWERRLNFHSARSRGLYELLRGPMLREGFVEVNFLALTMAWPMDLCVWRRWAVPRTDFGGEQDPGHGQHALPGPPHV
jgi:hypothetical protein